MHLKAVALGTGLCFTVFRSKDMSPDPCVSSQGPPGPPGPPGIPGRVIGLNGVSLFLGLASHLSRRIFLIVFVTVALFWINSMHCPLNFKDSLSGSSATSLQNTSKWMINLCRLEEACVRLTRGERRVCLGLPRPLTNAGLIKNPPLSMLHGVRFRLWGVWGHFKVLWRLTMRKQGDLPKTAQYWDCPTNAQCSWCLPLNFSLMLHFWKATFSSHSHLSPGVFSFCIFWVYLVLTAIILRWLSWAHLPQAASQTMTRRAAFNHLLILVNL